MNLVASMQIDAAQKLFQQVKPLLKQQIAFLVNVAKKVKFGYPATRESKKILFNIEQKLIALILLGKSYYRFVRNKRSILNVIPYDDSAYRHRAIDHEYRFHYIRRITLEDKILEFQKKATVKRVFFDIKVLIKLEKIIKLYSIPPEYKSMPQAILYYILKEKLDYVKKKMYRELDVVLQHRRMIDCLAGDITKLPIWQAKGEININSRSIATRNSKYLAMIERALSHCGLSCSEENEAKTTARSTDSEKALFQQEIGYTEFWNDMSDDFDFGDDELTSFSAATV